MPEFKVIKGGIPDEPTYNFIDAHITDTRLMGVLGLRVHWLYTPADPSDIEGVRDIYHFYYYDIEELGLDSLNVFELVDEDALRIATKSCFGGLGAKLVPVTEKEVKYLVNWFVEETIKKNEKLPDNIDCARFILKDKPVLTEDEYKLICAKMCTSMQTNYGVINYYLMRLFGKDYEGAELLKAENALAEDFDDISLETHATFLQNSIEEFHNNDGSTSYMNESLVQTKKSHYIVVSEIKVAGQRITYAKKLRAFEISIEEASMILTRGEFVTVYRICVPMEDFDVDFATFSIGTTRTSHETGDMFMEFKPHNAHVDRRVFKLYEDLHALYYVSDYGELIIAAYTPEDIRDVEYRIKSSNLMPDLQIMIKMQLATQVLYEFAQSGYTHFGAFIKSLE
ncbi:MAG: hypothetical protein MJ150_03805 [Clostridia bacterium]|nr:hypothetical protein [Clostridia bacterium]